MPKKLELEKKQFSMIRTRRNKKILIRILFEKLDVWIGKPIFDVDLENLESDLKLGQKTK